MHSMTRYRRPLDGLAMGASGVCLVHCLLQPALFVGLPALAAVMAFPAAFHDWAFAIALPTSLLALAAGHRAHRRRKPAALALSGLALLALGVFAAPSTAIETGLTVPGSLLLALGHALNWRATRH